MPGAAGTGLVIAALDGEDGPPRRRMLACTVMGTAAAAAVSPSLAPPLLLPPPPCPRNYPLSRTRPSFSRSRSCASWARAHSSRAFTSAPCSADWTRRTPPRGAHRGRVAKGTATPTAPVALRVLCCPPQHLTSLLVVPFAPLSLLCSHIDVVIQRENYYSYPLAAFLGATSAFANQYLALYRLGNADLTYM